MHQLLLLLFPCIIGMFRCSILQYCIDLKYRNHTKSKFPHLHFVPLPFKDILLVLSYVNLAMCQKYSGREHVQ
jgi:hypothetical protein